MKCPRGGLRATKFARWGYDLGVPMEQRDLVIFTVQVENGGRPG
jgi:hypothetical protein